MEYFYGYKGFDKNLKFLGVQFELDKSFLFSDYSHYDSKLLSFYSNPGDVFNIHPFVSKNYSCEINLENIFENRYCKVMCEKKDLKIDKPNNILIPSKLIIIEEISIEKLIQDTINYAIDTDGDLNLNKIYGYPIILMKNLTIGGTLDISGNNLITLSENMSIGKNLYISDSTSIPQGCCVGRDLRIFTKNNNKSINIPNDLFVGGYLYIGLKKYRVIRGGEIKQIN